MNTYYYKHAHTECISIRLYISLAYTWLNYISVRPITTTRDSNIQAIGYTKSISYYGHMNWHIHTVRR